MNDLSLIRIHVVCTTIPTPIAQEQIRSELRKLILSLDANASPEDKSGSGSWWIICWGYVADIGAWLLTQTLSWGVKKMLDSTSRKLTQGEKSERTEQPQDSPSPPPNESPPMLATNVGLQKDNLYGSLTTFMDDNDVDHCTVAVWAPEGQGPLRGHILKIDRKEGKLQPTVILLPTKEDFDSFLDPGR